MKLKKKIWLFIIAMILVFIFIPLMIVLFANGLDGMGLLLLLIFVLNPLESILVGILSGTNFDKLWWMVLMNAILFPICYWIVLQEIVFEFFIYSSIYLVLGIASMIITTFVKNNN